MKKLSRPCSSAVLLVVTALGIRVGYHDARDRKELAAKAAQRPSQ